ncbi:MAG: lysophospholipid acyltransferase family protein [archaeon]
MIKSTIKPIWLKNIDILVNILRASLKSFIILIFFTVCVILTLILRIVTLITVKWFYIKINTKYIIRPLSRSLLFIAGVKLNRPKDVDILNAIIVSNHWGYLDSLVLMALSPCIVISNVDVRQMPFIGRIMMLMGFVFVDRQNNRSIPIVLEKATNLLNQTNLNVAFFPEGGTGDGFELKKFNSSFFELAFTTKKNVVPVVIQIETINKETPNQDNINQVVFHNSRGNIIIHLLRLLQLKSIGIKFTILPQISYYEIYSKYLSRKKICEIAEKKFSDFLDKNKRF